MNIADIIFQLFVFAVPVIFIAIFFLSWRSFKMKKEQLNRIEEKLNSINKKEH
ncbi:hypothetical protein [Neobacillus sp. LXY-1]|uniref:hypothetical protein n=1 Tax=Neobacillus sp. LXY-1 TaxID=3379133 RepID=UPI003EE2B204